MADQKKRGTVENLTNAGKGRPKGVPNKATTAIKDMIVQALDKAGGVEYLVEQAEKNPGPFMSLVAKVLPTQVTGNDGGPIETRSIVTAALSEATLREIAGLGDGK